MAFTKSVSREAVIREDGVITVRAKVSVFEDGALISERVNARTYVPGENTEDLPARLQALCAFVWTPQVITDYQARIAAILASITSHAP